MNEMGNECERYYPHVGDFTLMDGYYRTHYVEPSSDGHDRMMVVFNYWTDEVPEAGRDPDLAMYQQGL